MALDMISGIIFDKDGTLFDFRSSWGRWTARLLGTLAHDTATLVGLAQAIGFDPNTNTFAPDSPVIAGTPHEIAACLAPHLPEMGLVALEARINGLAAQAEMTPAVALRPLLQSLRDRGLRLAVATNDSEMPARAHLAQHRITDLFDLVLGCDSGYGAKPGPGMLLAFATHAGINAASLVMVGDSRHDLMAGRAAGMLTVAVLTGVALADDLADLADVVLADISGLPAWLDGLQMARSAG
jgi:phosphoglycolate phosphatase